VISVDNISDLAAESAGLYDRLGSFWEHAFQDSDLIAALATGGDALSAQSVQRAVESAGVVGYSSVPTEVRYRWRFVTLRDPQRDSGGKLAVRVDDDEPMQLGVQTSSVYAAGTTPSIGGNLPMSGKSGYPFSSASSVQTAIADSILSPSVVLLPGKDFTIDATTILFEAGSDPFDLGFPARVVASGGGEYREVALWCRDAYVDNDLPRRFAGYAVGVEGAASAWLSRYISALWAFATSGGADGAFSAYIHAALDLPCTADHVETVEYVGQLESGYGVITDRTVYRISSSDDTDLVVGDAIPPYSPITNIASVLSGRELTNAGVVVLPLDDNDVRGVKGVSASAELSDVTYAGADSAGNPRLRFTLHGSENQVASFWEGVDAFCETNGIDQSDVLGKYLYDYRPEQPGAVWGSLSPLSFFIDYYYGNSAKCVVVDAARLGDYGLDGLGRLDDCRKYLPPGVRLIVSVTGESADTMELGETVSEPACYALAEAADSIGAGSDSVSVTWTPVCRGR